MNRIVYSTDPAVMAKQVAPIAHRETMREWEERPRKTQRQCRDANNALNIEYRRRAAACGLSFHEYLRRFGITLR